MPEGIEALEDAFAAAVSESDLVQSDDVEAPEPGAEADDTPAADEQAADEASDQPEVAETTDDEDDDMQSLVDDMLEENDESGDESDEKPSEVTLDTEITVDFGDGAETVTIQELVNRGLMQADYTRKTQELAAQRADLKDAADFMAAFNEDPMEFARTLAVKAGLLEEGARPVKQVEAAKIRTNEEIEAEIEKRVQERLESDPRMVTAQTVAAREAINSEFDRIAEANGVEISRELRQQIVDEAARRGTTDLELVFEARMARVRAARERTSGKRRASTSRPTASPATAPADEDKKPSIDTIDDAFEQALAEVG